MLFIDNHNAFRNDIETCIKFYSKIRGKRSQSAEFLGYFNQLMTESFPEENPIVDNSEEVVSRKRSRLSTDSNEPVQSGEVSDKPDRKKSTLTKTNSTVSHVEELEGTQISSSQRVCSDLFFNFKVTKPVPNHGVPVVP